MLCNSEEYVRPNPASKIWYKWLPVEFKQAPTSKATWVLEKPANTVPYLQTSHGWNENFITWLHLLYLQMNETLDKGIPYKIGRWEWPVKMNTRVIPLHHNYQRRNLHYSNRIIWNYSPTFYNTFLSWQGTVKRMGG